MFLDTKAYYAASPVSNASRQVLSPQGMRTPDTLDTEQARFEPGKKDSRFDSFECQTCKNRTYQDGSNDPGVSFKSPTKIDPRAAASAVRSHEMEHVFREKSKAQSEGREVVSQTVTIHSGICAECGKTYTAGGTTRTVTKGKDKSAFSVGLTGNATGQTLNKVA